MYVVLRNKEIIAAHDDSEVVFEYVRSQTDSSDMKILKIKKHKTRELENIPIFEDIYLVRYGNFYVPYEQYQVLKDLSIQKDMDLVYCRDILMRILEDGLESTKDVSVIQKAISIVISQIEELDSADYDELNKLQKSMNEINGGFKL